MINVSSKFKRQMDDWIEKGICARHKYINACFKFLWRISKKALTNSLLVFCFIMGVVFYKWIWNKENK